MELNIFILFPHEAGLHLDYYLGLDPLVVDHLAAGRVEAGHGHLEGGAVGEGEDLLDRSLPEGVFAY